MRLKKFFCLIYLCGACVNCASMDGSNLTITLEKWMANNIIFNSLYNHCCYQEVSDDKKVLHFRKEDYESACECYKGLIKKVYNTPPKPSKAKNLAPEILINSNIYSSNLDNGIISNNISYDDKGKTLEEQIEPLIKKQINK